MIDLGTDLQNVERASRVHAQQMARSDGVDPIETIKAAVDGAFAAIASRTELRAGIRIASESRGDYKGRGRPSVTWLGLLHNQLELSSNTSNKSLGGLIEEVRSRFPLLFEALRMPRTPRESSRTMARAVARSERPPCG